MPNVPEEKSMAKEREVQSRHESSSIKSVYKKMEHDKKIAVIGAGWFGVHSAIEFSRAGYSVVLFEKNANIFSGTSGTFGVRIHAGQHYPRSPATRMACLHGFHEMQISYPELYNKHEHSVYALGRKDADGEDPKVDESTFRRVCKEFQLKGEFDLAQSPFNPAELLSAYDINEPSGIVGQRLRAFFEKRLQKAEVTVKCSFTITSIQKQEKGIWVGNEYEGDVFSSVINATGFQQAFLPLSKPLPFKMNVFYQPCLALVYNDRFPSEKPISFIVMDGWFPCLMPYDDRLTTEKPVAKYIMTHGKFTILDSCDSAEKAHKVFAQVNDKFIEKNVKPACEKEMLRFWPGFLNRFEYTGWKGSVLAKMKTEQEFRGAIVFQEPTMGVINIFPGKITNIFDSFREAKQLVEVQNVAVSEGGYRYIANGVLDSSKEELMRPVLTRNTCTLKPYKEALEKRQKNELRMKKKTSRVSFLAKEVYSISSIIKILAAGGTFMAIKKHSKDFSECSFTSLAWGLTTFSIATYVCKKLCLPQNSFVFSFFKNVKSEQEAGNQMMCSSRNQPKNLH